MRDSRADETGWLEEIPSRLTGMVDLICIAGAGGGASAFRGWARDLPAFAALLACRLPGRESRIDEPPVASLSEAAGALARSYLIRRAEARPVVLFGHSMGAVLAFEAARRLADAGRKPRSLVLCASAPPRCRESAEIGRGELEALLLAYDPGNAALVGNAELSQSLLPLLESDIGLLRGHGVARDARLDAPAWLFGGTQDRVVPMAATLRWAEHFTGEVTSAQLPGGHNFPFRESRRAVLQRLSDILRDAARNGGR